MNNNSECMCEYCGGNEFVKMVQDGYACVHQ